MKIEKIFPLSPMQEGMLFTSIEENSKAYIEQLTIEIGGNINLLLLNQSINNLIKKYEILRTSIVYENIKSPKQVVLQDRPVEINYLNWCNKKNIDGAIQKFLDADFEDEFDLARDVLFRMHLVRREHRKFILIFTFHHIILDGWSIAIILKEFLNNYALLLEGIPPAKIKTQSFGSYVEWINNQSSIKGKRYWKDYLKNCSAPTKIPFHQKQSKSSEYKYEDYDLLIDNSIISLIIEFTKKYNVTVNSFFQTVWAILLSKYNVSDSCIFGTVTSGRNVNIDSIEDMVGLFINTVPFFIDKINDYNFKELIKKVNEDNIKSNDYQYFSLATIQNQTSLKSNLINHIFIFENYPLKSLESDEKKHIEIDNIGIKEYTSYDLNIAVVPGGSFLVKFVFNGNTLSDCAIQEIANHYLYLIKEIVERPTIGISRINLLTNNDSERILNYKNKKINSGIFPDIFTQLKSSQPDRIAVEYKDNQLSYGELDILSNKLANIILLNGVKEKEVVAIKCDRSIEYIIALLAVIKVKGVFLPISVDQPNNRIRKILSDSGCKLILYSESTPIVEGFKGSTVVVNPNKIQEYSKNITEFNYSLTDLAYLIYTSGSTGDPKGVLVSHSALKNYVDSIKLEFENNFSQKDIVYATTNFAFDVSVGEVFISLYNGSRLVICDQEKHLLPFDISNDLIKKSITFTYLAPSLLEHIYFELKRSNCKIPLNKLYVGVDKIYFSTLNKFLTISDSIKIVNAYGPTEATISCTAYHVDSSREQTGIVPIGKPCLNQKVYILDENLKVVPYGVQGEISIAGNGLAEGYINQVEATNDKFINNPYNIEEKLYKSGDIGCCNASGDIEFQGRKDNQIKLRGYRIEPEEIEKTLNSLTGIEKSIVLLNKEKQILEAYYIGKEFKEEELKAQMEYHLPEYMVPALYFWQSEIPLNANGKVNLSALKREKDLKNLDVYESIEQLKLAEVWRDTLNDENLGLNPNSNFFNIGGHSINAITLISLISKEFGVNLSIKEIFNNPLLNELALLIGNKKKSTKNELKRAERREYYELNSAQKRIFALQQFNLSDYSYLISGIVELKNNINEEIVHDCLIKIANKHKALKSRIVLVDGIPYQLINENEHVDFKVVKTVSTNLSNKINEFIRPFDLINDQHLFKSRLFDIENEKKVLLVLVHHIFADGISMNIIGNEFNKIINDSFDFKTQYQSHDFSVWQNSKACLKRNKFLKEYWAEQFRDDIPVVNLPYDYPRGNLIEFSSELVEDSLSPKEIKLINSLSRQLEVTNFISTFTLYTILIHKLTNQKDIITGIPVSGRNHFDTKSIVGMFVNTLPIRLNISSDMSFTEYVFRIKQKVLDTLDNQDLPFEELIAELNLEQDFSRNPLFDILFIFNDFDSHDNLAYRNDIKLNSSLNSKFDLAFELTTYNNAWNLRLIYNNSLFKKESVRRIITYFKEIIKSIPTLLNAKIENIDILPKDERRLLTTQFNNTCYKNSQFVPVHKLIEIQSTCTPYAIAAQVGNDQVSYSELNNRANGLSSKILEKTKGRKEIIFLHLERNLDLVISIIGILKSGCSYVPIDPDIPDQRKALFYKDINPGIVISSTRIQSFGNDVDYVFTKDLITFNVDNNFESINSLKEDLAYIIYTSGTTGKPKAVGIEHKGLLNYALWQKNEYALKSQHNALNLLSVSFDGFLSFFYSTLISGGKIVITPEKQRKDFDFLCNIIEKLNITNTSIVPGIYEVLINTAKENQLTPLQFVVLGGEEASKTLLEKSKKQYENICLHNEYGPTELTVAATSNLNMTPDDYLNIGNPIENTEVFIINDRRHLVPIGIKGELCATGEGVSSGYINAPEFTHDKFVSLPEYENRRVYLTGDYAKWENDGKIKLFGRSDDQVKIRGYRIELKEVICSLNSLKEIDDCTVTIHGEGQNKKMICFYISKKYTEEVEIRTKLCAMPDYMIPEEFQRVDKFPLTTNGKIDYQKLIEHRSLKRIEKSSIESNDQIQKILINIWSQVLDINEKELSIDNNFFEIGGNSLNIVRINHLVNEQFNVQEKVTTLFRFPTIRKLADYIRVQTNEIEGKSSVVNGDDDEGDLNILLETIDIIE